MARFNLPLFNANSVASINVLPINEPLLRVRQLSSNNISKYMAYSEGSKNEMVIFNASGDEACKEYATTGPSSGNTPVTGMESGCSHQIQSHP